MPLEGKVIAFPFSTAPDGSPPVLILESAEDELRDLYERSGASPMLRAHYKKRIQYLAEHGRQAVFHGEWFEHLEDELYSMRFNGISRLGNLHIIYCFYGKYIVLLVPFLEQGSKSYDEGKRTARARLKLIKEGKVVWNS